MNKINYPQLTGALSRTIEPAYWLQGDDPFLRQEAEQQIKQAAQNRGFDQTFTWQTDIDFTSDLFSQETDNLSLFNEKKVILVRSNKPLDAGTGKLFNDYLSRANPDIILIISTPRQTSTAKWLTSLQAQLLTVMVWPIDRPHLPGWLQQQARSFGLNLPQAAANIIADHYEGNLAAAKQAITQLAILGDPQALAPENLTQYLTQQAHYPIFDASDALLAQDHTRASRILHTLEHQSPQELPALVSILAKEFRTLAALTQGKKNTSLPQLFKQHRIWPKKQNIYQTALQRWPLDKIYDALLALAEVDRLARGFEKGNAWLRLRTSFMHY